MTNALHTNKIEKANNNEIPTETPTKHTCIQRANNKNIAPNTYRTKDTTNYRDI